jgi:hypothetical protein
VGLFTRRPKRYWSQEAHRANLARQVGGVPQVLRQLTELGATADRPLRLEYFFYTDAEQKAAALGAALRQKEYAVEAGRSPAGRNQYCVTGWTTPVVMDVDAVCAWSAEMCELGFTHDAEFDGWGTNPNQ